MRWSSLIPTGFLVSRGTWDPSHSPLSFHLRGSHALRLGFPSDSISKAVLPVSTRCNMSLKSLYPHSATLAGFNTLSVWALSLSLAATQKIDYFFLFLRVLGCFGSPGLPYYNYVFIIAYTDITLYGFPHSDIHGSLPACGSPWLFAARCVLRRLLAPRHPPCALCSLVC